MQVLIHTKGADGSTHREPFNKIDGITVLNETNNFSYTREDVGTQRFLLVNVAAIAAIEIIGEDWKPE